MKALIEEQFHTVDVDGDGTVGIDEFRLDCIHRQAYTTIEVVDDAFNKLMNDADKKAGGISLARYQELYADFLSSTDASTSAVYLFGPLIEL
jgi:Ca2+-binding EF-hand superfamily protein